MTSRIFFTLFQLLLALFTATAQIPGGTDRQQRGYSGPVREVRRAEALQSPSHGGGRNEPARPTLSETFDPGGNLISETLYANGRPIEEITILRDSLGRMTSRSQVDPAHGAAGEWSNYSYGDNGVLADVTRYTAPPAKGKAWSTRTYFRYDTARREIERRDIFPSGALQSITATEYDRRGRPARQIQYGASGRVERKLIRQYDSLFTGSPLLAETLTYYSGDTLIDSTVVVERDTARGIQSHTVYASQTAHPDLVEGPVRGSHGLRFRTVRRAAEGGYILSAITNNSHGNALSIEESRYEGYPGGTAPPRETTSYQIQIEYDEAGNWTRRIWKRRTGNDEYRLFKTEQQEIRYYR
jgi:hypothetical protein